mmetsp:Transcript_3596/g.8580  ORF Transcript_3596/g.8580 Transcript_3596/m.8580 type:complete len:487 (+) Transcript_3596:4147-5607(+)
MTQRSRWLCCISPGSPKTKMAASPFSSTVTWRVVPLKSPFATSMILPRSFCSRWMSSFPGLATCTLPLMKSTLTSRFSASMSIWRPRTHLWRTNHGTNRSSTSAPQSTSSLSVLRMWCGDAGLGCPVAPRVSRLELNRLDEKDFIFDRRCLTRNFGVPLPSNPERDPMAWARASSATLSTFSVTNSSRSALHLWTASVSITPAGCTAWLCCGPWLLAPAVSLRAGLAPERGAIIAVDSLRRLSPATFALRSAGCSSTTHTWPPSRASPCTLSRTCSRALGAMISSELWERGIALPRSRRGSPSRNASLRRVFIPAHSTAIRFPAAIAAWTDNLDASSSVRSSFAIARTQLTARWVASEIGMRSASEEALDGRDPSAESSPAERQFDWKTTRNASPAKQSMSPWCASIMSVIFAKKDDIRRLKLSIPSVPALEYASLSFVKPEISTSRTAPHCIRGSGGQSMLPELSQFNCPSKNASTVRRGINGVI